VVLGLFGVVSGGGVWGGVWGGRGYNPLSLKSRRTVPPHQSPLSMRGGSFRETSLCATEFRPRQGFNRI